MAKKTRTPRSTSKKRKPVKGKAIAPIELAEETQQGGRVGIRFYEAGTSGLRETSGFVQEAYNAQLFWPQVYPIYDRLRRSSPEIVTMRQVVGAWAQNIDLQVDLPEDPSDDDKRWQEFLLSEFDNWEGGSKKLISTIFDFIPWFGWGYFECPRSIRSKNWKPPVKEQETPDEWRSEADDELLGIRRFAFRGYQSFDHWVFDSKKKLLGMVQQDYPNPPISLPLYDRASGRLCLHLTFGDPINPEGLTPMEAAWRQERLKYGYEVVQGIGSEHTAGYLKVNKTTPGVLSASDEAEIQKTAENLMSAQEGNYGYFPEGLDGNIIDTPFSAAATILETIRYYSIAMLTLWNMQFIALNTMTNTGALASQVDSTDIAVFTFNSWADGFAAQIDAQIGKRLYEWNQAEFPNITKRMPIKFTHIERSLALSELGNFLSSMDGRIPLGEDDHKAFRKRSGFLPQNNPDKPIVVQSPKPEPPPTDEITPEMKAQAARQIVEEALHITSRAGIHELDR